MFFVRLICPLMEVFCTLFKTFWLSILLSPFSNESFSNESKIAMTLFNLNYSWWLELDRFSTKDNQLPVGGDLISRLQLHRLRFHQRAINFL
jgi:hypothetical protein